MTKELDIILSQDNLSQRNLGKDDNFPYYYSMDDPLMTAVIYDKEEIDLTEFSPEQIEQAKALENEFFNHPEHQPNPDEKEEMPNEDHDVVVDVIMEFAAETPGNETIEQKDYDNPFDSSGVFDEHNIDIQSLVFQALSISGDNVKAEEIINRGLIVNEDEKQQEDVTLTNQEVQFFQNFICAVMLLDNPLLVKNKWQEFQKNKNIPLSDCPLLNGDKCILTENENIREIAGDEFIESLAITFLNKQPADVVKFMKVCFPDTHEMNVWDASFPNDSIDVVLREAYPHLTDKEILQIVFPDHEYFSDSDSESDDDSLSFNNYSNSSSDDEPDYVLNSSSDSPSSSSSEDEQLFSSSDEDEDDNFRAITTVRYQKQNTSYYRPKKGEGKIGKFRKEKIESKKQSLDLNDEKKSDSEPITDPNKQNFNMVLKQLLSNEPKIKLIQSDKNETGGTYDHFEVISESEDKDNTQTTNDNLNEREKNMTKTREQQLDQVAPTILECFEQLRKEQERTQAHLNNIEAFIKIANEAKENNINPNPNSNSNGFFSKLSSIGEWFSGVFSKVFSSKNNEENTHNFFDSEKINKQLESNDQLDHPNDNSETNGGLWSNLSSFFSFFVPKFLKPKTSSDSENDNNDVRKVDSAGAGKHNTDNWVEEDKENSEGEEVNEDEEEARSSEENGEKSDNYFCSWDACDEEESGLNAVGNTKSETPLSDAHTIYS